MPVMWHVEGFGIGGVTSSFTVSLAATAGRLLVIAIGGTQSRTYVSGMSGWAHIVIPVVSNGTISVFYKIAGVSEPSSYNIVWSGNLGGTAAYFEMKDMDTVPLVASYSAFVAAGTSIAVPAYNVRVPSFVLSLLNLNINDTWSVNNSFTEFVSAPLKTSYRIYSVPAVAEVTTWSGPSRDASTGLIIFKGKTIY